MVNAQDVSNDAPDLSPLGAQREWVQQAEDNVIERLFQAGLLDAPSDFDKTLEALANNILVYNNIQTSRPIRVRTLLTEPLESLAVGNTIILSKSLIDTTSVITADGAQQMGNLNAILAFQLAHIILGHRLDTKYAFSDRLLFPSTSVFERIPMHHTDKDNEEAAKKAMELLNAKELAGGQQYFGLYLEQLQQRVKTLPALNTAHDRRRPDQERQRHHLLDAGHGPQGHQAGHEGPEAAGGDAAGQLPALRPLDRPGGPDAHQLRAHPQRTRQDAVRG